MEHHITEGNVELLSIAQQYPKDILLLDFYADWCQPCKAISPYLHELSQEYSLLPDARNLILCKINVDDPGNEDICASYKVRVMPTFCWIFNMCILDRFEGADKKAVKQKSQKYCTQ